MLEFMLSRLTMSVCAIIVLLTLAPVVCSIPWSTEGTPSRTALEELALRFQEVAIAPGDARLMIALSDYLDEEGEYLVLRQGSLWLMSGAVQEARPLPEGFQIYVPSYSGEIKVEQARLEWASTLTLSKSVIRDMPILEAHIENLEATSETFSAKPFTSSSLL